VAKAAPVRSLLTQRRFARWRFARRRLDAAGGHRDIEHLRRHSAPRPTFTPYESLSTGSRGARTDACPSLRLSMSGRGACEDWLLAVIRGKEVESTHRMQSHRSGFVCDRTMAKAAWYAS